METPYKKKIYDCFIFYNELELLSLRLHELYDAVDYFVICEANITFRGQPKPLIFADNQNMFKAFSDKIKYIAVTDMPAEGSAWDREYHQRSALRRTLSGLDPRDVVIISDVDEIIRPEAVNYIRNNDGYFQLYMKMYQFYINTFACDWAKVFAYSWSLDQSIGDYSDVRVKMAETFDRFSGRNHRIENGGWHFTFLGGADKVREKLKAYSHTEPWQQHILTPEAAERQLLLLTPVGGVGILELRPVDETFPKYVRDNLARLTELGFVKDVMSRVREVEGQLAHNLDLKRQSEARERYKDVELDRARMAGFGLNLALNKPALQSSVAEWSYKNTPEEDARGGNRGEISELGWFGFHTDREQNPWWQVDLEADFIVEEVRIYNRWEQPERLRHFSFLKSRDGKIWEVVFRKTDDTVFDTAPYVVRLEPGESMRFFRIRLDGYDYLHFDACLIYGRLPTREEQEIARANNENPKLNDNHNSIKLTRNDLLEIKKLRASKFAVLFRIHYWDQSVSNAFEILKNGVRFGDVWVVPDETNGHVDVPEGVQVFPIDVTMVKNMGLPAFPDDNVMWYNNDYGLYLFYREHQEYDYYVLVEHDAIITFSLDGLIVTVSELGLDFAAMPNKVGDQEWISMPTCTEIWTKDVVRPHLLCFCIIAGHTIPSLLSARLAHADKLFSGEIQRWPLAEGFVPTQLAQSGFEIGDLSRLVDTELYDWWPPTHFSEIRELEPGKIIHPVLAGDRYIESLLRYDHLPPSSWFAPESVLRRKLGREPEKKVFPGLARALIERGELEFLFSLEDFCREAPSSEFKELISKAVDGVVAGSEVTNLSVEKRGFSSSISPWSRAPLREQDASGALAGEADGTYAFHTNFELNPWWIVDLDAVCVVDEIILYNRLDAERERSNNLTVWTSTNSRRWTLCFERSDSFPFGGADGLPLHVKLERPRPARFIRVELAGITALHLDKVSVRGRLC
jgi:beta-1,4-mannosyl-glycoprotein beta-1,4-N-acetylglucosaminyltransferase